MGQGPFSSLKERVNEEQIQKDIHEFPVVIYTKTGCGYCKYAKELLDEESIKYKEHELNRIERENPNEYQRLVNGLVYVTRQTSVPQVFICGNFIGGFTQLKMLHEKGELRSEISRCSDT